MDFLVYRSDLQHNSQQMYLEIILRIGNLSNLEGNDFICYVDDEPM